MPWLNAVVAGRAPAPRWQLLARWWQPALEAAAEAEEPAVEAAWGFTVAPVSKPSPRSSCVGPLTSRRSRMRRRAVLAATAVLAAVVGCEAGVHEPTIGGKPNAAASKYIKEASDADFESIVAAHPDGLFAEFYAPWGGHCKQLAPVFEEVAEKLSKKKFADPPIPCVKVR